MSKYDMVTPEVRFGATSRTPPAPGCMDFPGAGPFRLLNLNLWETHRGAREQREHRHAVYHLVIFEQGDNWFSLDGAMAESRRGLCCLTAPSGSHCFLPHRKGTTVYHALTFTFGDLSRPPSWQALLSHYTGLSVRALTGPFVLGEASLVRLSAVLAELRPLVPPHSAAVAAQLHQSLLRLLLLVAEAASQEAGSGEPQEVVPPEVRAKRQLDQQYARGVPLVDIARSAGVSVAHLGRVFRNRYGVSPGRYRDTLRLEAARNLVANSDLRVKEIAYALGYPDAATFSKAFLRNTGTSPTTFRER